LQSGEQRFRVSSVDALRGIIMILMAIDHVRDYMHAAALQFQPENLARATAAIFFTRWVTHFCAPVFLFTAGAGAYLSFYKTGDKRRVSRFLLTRGLWLVVLEVTAVRVVMTFSLTRGMLILEVIWVLGVSMMILAALIHLPLRVLAPVSLLVIVLHNLLDPIRAAQFGSFAWLWTLLHQIGVIPVKGVTILAAYSIVPWFAVMSAGYCFGQVLTREAAERQRWMMRIGAAATVAFVLLRALNGYGDPRPWAMQSSPLMTLCSFLNTTKYPPSLDFLLMTLGPAIFAMAFLDRLRLSKQNPILVFGRTPLFYFLAHLFLIHIAAMALSLATYGRAGFLFYPIPTMGGPRELYPPDYGWDLWVVYVVWACLVAALYPICRWYAGIKDRRSDWWLRYL
jgi:uncharacterized membrane protein